MLTSAQIQARIRQLASVLKQECFTESERPLLVCTLKGAAPFFHDLCLALQQLSQSYDLEFVRVSSYHGTSSTGTVSSSDGSELIATPLHNRTVILCEDIVDTGTTLEWLVPQLHAKGAASVHVCTLLDKRLPEEKKKYTAAYTGFSIPNHFIVGYGLDYNEWYRDTSDIFVLGKTGIIACDRHYEKLKEELS